MKSLGLLPWEYFENAQSVYLLSRGVKPASSSTLLPLVHSSFNPSHVSAFSASFLSALRPILVSSSMGWAMPAVVSDRIDSTTLDRRHR